MHALYPEHEEVMQCAVYNHRKGLSSICLVAFEFDYAGVLGSREFGEAFFLCLFGFSAFLLMSFEVFRFHTTVRAWLWNASSVHYFRRSHLLDQVESATCNEKREKKI